MFQSGFLKVQNNTTTYKTVTLPLEREESAERSSIRSAATDEETSFWLYKHFSTWLSSVEFFKFFKCKHSAKTYSTKPSIQLLAQCIYMGWQTAYTAVTMENKFIFPGALFPNAYPTVRFGSCVHFIMLKLNLGEQSLLVHPCHPLLSKTMYFYFWIFTNINSMKV